MGPVVPGDVREAVASGRADIQRALLGGATTGCLDAILLVGSLDRVGADAFSSIPRQGDDCW